MMRILPLISEHEDEIHLGSHLSSHINPKQLCLLVESSSRPLFILNIILIITLHPIKLPLTL